MSRMNKSFMYTRPTSTSSSIEQQVASIQKYTVTEQYPINIADNIRRLKIFAFLSRKNFKGLDTSPSILPGDVYHNGVNLSAGLRDQELFRQYKMDWNNHYMTTSASAERYNNPGMAVMVKQKQFTVPNVYTQFAAFQKGLSAAFGSLNPNG